jgi:hypothetical protein
MAKSPVWTQEYRAFLLVNNGCVFGTEMYSVNRQVAIIKPKEPHVDWINSLPGVDEPSDIDELNCDCTA